MGRTLVLNATYEPLSVVPKRRAVVLVLAGKAEIVESGDEVWRSENAEVAVPSVVKLRYFVKVPFERRVPLTRNAIFARDGHRCQYCGRQAENIDHVLPRSRGGPHAWENVVASCRRCNLLKADRSPTEAGLRLRSTPRAPKRHGWVLAAAGRPLDPRWQPYLGLGVGAIRVDGDSAA